jgi:TolA-binding protein
MSNSKNAKNPRVIKKKPFYCNACYYGFDTLQHYNYHLESIKHINRVSTENTDLHVCSICQKSFFHSSSLYRHRSKCKETQDISKVDHLETEITELRKEIELLKNNTNNNNNTKIEHQNIENQKIENQNIGKQNNNIIINCFGNENMDYITDKVILHCMNKIYGSIPLLIEKIHFDPDHPENNNVKIPNKKLPHAKIMNHKKEWQIVKKKDVIDSMIDNGYNLLDEKFQEKSHELADQKQKYFRNFQAKYEDGDKETMKNIKDEVEMLVINNSRK